MNLLTGASLLALAKSIYLLYIVLTVRLREAARWQLTQNCFRQLSESIQLFRERLSEKVHATIPKGIVVGGFEFTVL